VIFRGSNKREIRNRLPTHAHTSSCHVDVVDSIFTALYICPVVVGEAEESLINYHSLWTPQLLACGAWQATWFEEICYRQIAITELCEDPNPNKSSSYGGASGAKPAVLHGDLR
jgi:hypothetical protein